MIKKLFILFTLVVVVGLTLLFIRIQNKPTSIYPLPYFVDSSQYKTEELEEIKKSDVLIIGDHLGLELGKYIPEVNDTLSKNLRNQLNIYNWSTRSEGLHRTIKKLKVLKKLPPIIIYHGGSEEFYEDRLLTADKDIYDKNMKLFKDDRFYAFKLGVSRQ